MILMNCKNILPFTCAEIFAKLNNVLTKNFHFENLFRVFLKTYFSRSISSATLFQYNIKPIFFFVWKLVSRASLPRGPFFEIRPCKRRKWMKSSITWKNPKKWFFFRKDVHLYNNKKLILKKGPRDSLALETSFQTKKILFLDCTGRELRRRYFVENMFWEKRETSFRSGIFSLKHCLVLQISLHR